MSQGKPQSYGFFRFGCLLPALVLAALLVCLLAGCVKHPTPVVLDATWQATNAQNQLCTQVTWQYLGQGVLRTPTRHGWLVKSGTPAVPENGSALVYVPDPNHEWKVGEAP